MNTYRWEDLTVGLRHEFEVTIDRGMMDRFRADTGDINPLHADLDFAKSRGFPDVVVFGMLTASFYSSLVGVHLPGRNAILHGVDVSFVKSVLPGDRLTISGEIVYLNEAYRQVELDAKILNQRGDKVSRAKIKVGVHE